MRQSRCAWLLLALAWSLDGVGCAAEPARPPTGRPIILLALDAADWLVIDPLIEAGSLPTFARLRASGRTGTLRATPPLLSPILWTTIATGREPEDHGVLDFMVDLPSGGQAPVAVTSRRVPALWNLFSDAERRVSVVGWWATWPAENLLGVVVSDRVAPQLTHADGKLDPQAISPASEAARLQTALVRAETLTRDDLARYVPLTSQEYGASLRAPRASSARLYENRIAHLAAVVAATRTYSSMAGTLLASGPPDLLMVYLEGIDTVSHLFIRDRERGPRAIAVAYRDADALLARLAAAAPRQAWIVVCSDHGFEPADAGLAEDPADLAGPATAWHRPYGIVAAIQAGVLAGTEPPPASPREVGTVTPLDIAPTLLHAAALPVGASMPGRVVTALLSDEAAARPVARAQIPDRPAAGTPVAGPLDAEVLARLQALGYVGARSTSLARQNLGEILYRRGRLEAAERELRAVVEAQPQNLTALLWLAKALRDQGRPREAFRVYQGALRLPSGIRDAVVEAAEVAVAAGLTADARSLLSGLRPRPADAAALHTARAVLYRAEGRVAESERALKAALAIDPLSFEALSRLLDASIAARRSRDAMPFLKDAAQRAGRSSRHLALLGEGLLAAGDAAAAEDALGRALALAPDSVAVRIDLARAQIAQGCGDRALDTLQTAPTSAERSVLMGAAHSQRSQWAEAAARYREALAAGSATPELLNGLAWAELKQGRSREAAELLDRSLSLRSDQPEISRLRAQIQGTAGAR